MPRFHECGCCGAPASVHVMHEIGRPGSARHFCMRCADGQLPQAPAGRLREYAGLLFVAGLALLAIGLLAGWVPPAQSASVPAWQTAAAVLAATVIWVGWGTRSSGAVLAGCCVLLSVTALSLLWSAPNALSTQYHALGVSLTCIAVGASARSARQRRRRWQDDRLQEQELSQTVE